MNNTMIMLLARRRNPVVSVTVTATTLRRKCSSIINQQRSYQPHGQINHQQQQVRNMTGAASILTTDSNNVNHNISLAAATVMAAALTAGVVVATSTQCEEAANTNVAEVQQEQNNNNNKIQRQPSIPHARGNLRDPMTSYAINAMVREMKAKYQNSSQSEEDMHKNEQEMLLQVLKQLQEQDDKENANKSNDVNNNPSEQLVLVAERQQLKQEQRPVVSIQATSTANTNNTARVARVHHTSENVDKPVDDNDSTNANVINANTTLFQSTTPITSIVNVLPDEMSIAEVRIEEATRKAKQHAGGLKVFSGNGNMSLALEICRHLGVNLGKAIVGKFADGEVNIVIQENVRGKDVYVIQPTGPPVNDNIMELLLMVSTLRRSSARRITVVIPYYGYARQDRKMQARVPISAADVARLMEAMGIDRVIAVDLHCGQIQGFFGPRVPVDNLDGGIVGLDYFGCKDLHNPVIVSPDAGGVYRAKNFKEGLEQKYEMHDLSLAMIVKQRAKAGVVDQMDLVGDVRDCDCIIVDDMIDTAGTLCKAADVLIANGARRVFAFASHGLLSGPGNERIANSSLEEVVILNTLPTSPQREANEKLTELSVAPLLAQAIFNIHAKKSISALFK